MIPSVACHPLIQDNLRNEACQEVVGAPYKGDTHAVGVADAALESVFNSICKFERQYIKIISPIQLVLSNDVNY